MPRKPIAHDNPEQSKRFIEAAKTIVGASDLKHLDKVIRNARHPNSGKSAASTKAKTSSERS